MLMKWEKAHNKKISEQKFGYCNLWYAIRGSNPGHPDYESKSLIFTFIDEYVKSIGFMRFTPLFLFLKLPNNSQQNRKCDSQKYSQSRKIGI